MKDLKLSEYALHKYLDGAVSDLFALQRKYNNIELDLDVNAIIRKINDYKHIIEKID